MNQGSASGIGDRVTLADMLADAVNQSIETIQVTALHSICKYYLYTSFDTDCNPVIGVLRLRAPAHIVQ